MDETLKAWVILASLPGLGPVSQRQLLHRFGSPEAVLSAPARQLSGLGLRAAQISALRPETRQSADFLHYLDRVNHWLQHPQHHLLSPDHRHYPPLLGCTDSAPLLLFVAGDPEVLSLPQIAIVGSRNASRQGLETAHQFARYLSLSGFVPTSGLALGVDGEAHAGALSGLGLTVAVMGTGIDVIYPRRHAQLAQQIVAAGGALVSEFPLGSAPRPACFPRRNRIISGLSRGVLVVEAAPGSGSLITARLALEQGREVFAIPGSIHSPQSKGCHLLIREGAKLVECAADIFEELGAMLAPFAPEDRSGSDIQLLSTKKTGQTCLELLPGLNDLQKNLLQATDYSCTTLDQLVVRSGIAIEEIQALMLELELEGRVESVAGGYQRLG